MIARLRPDGGHHIVYDRAQRTEQRAECRRAALEGARRANAEERCHPQAKIHIVVCRSRLRLPIAMTAV